MSKSRKKNKKYTEAQKFAYQLARVQKGIDNPNSLVHESYENGKKSLNPKEKKPKKTEF